MKNKIICSLATFAITVMVLAEEEAEDESEVE